MLSAPLLALEQQTSSCLSNRNYHNSTDNFIRKSSTKSTAVLIFSDSLLQKFLEYQNKILADIQLLQVEGKKMSMVSVCTDALPCCKQLTYYIR